MGSVFFYAVTIISDIIYLSIISEGLGMKYAFRYSTCAGDVVIVEDGNSVTAIFFGSDIPPDSVYSETPLLKKACSQILEYLRGDRLEFSLPIKLEGTDFQRSVWNALLSIPYGETKSYSEIASAVGNPSSQRAVGSACSRNPILLVVPCHRVVSASGATSGYAAGVALKEKLLELEKRISQSFDSSHIG